MSAFANKQELVLNKWFAIQARPYICAYLHMCVCVYIYAYNMYI